MKQRKKKRIKKILIFIIISMIILLISIYLYNLYTRIEIYDSDYEIQRTQSTVKEQTVENVTEKSNTVANVLD